MTQELGSDNWAQPNIVKRTEAEHNDACAQLIKYFQGGCKKSPGPQLIGYLNHCRQIYKHRDWKSSCYKNTIEQITRELGCDNWVQPNIVKRSENEHNDMCSRIVEYFRGGCKKSPGHKLTQYLNHCRRVYKNGDWETTIYKNTIERMNQELTKNGIDWTTPRTKGNKRKINCISSSPDTRNREDKESTASIISKQRKR